METTTINEIKINTDKGILLWKYCQQPCGVKPVFVCKWNNPLNYKQKPIILIAVDLLKTLEGPHKTCLLQMIE